MFNTTEIQIAQIKDLRLIFFYNCEPNLKNSYLGLRIVYDNDKSLDLKYKDEYFNEFLTKVVNVYKKEKDLGNIKLLDENTEGILKDIDNLPIIKSKEATGHLQNHKIDIFNNRRIELSRITPYMKDMLIKFIWSMEQKENIQLKSFLGNNDRFLCSYMIKNKQFSIPAFVNLDRYDKFNINFSYHNGATLIVNSHIDFKLDYVNSLWIDQNKILSGKNIYHVDKNKFEKLARMNQNYIFYEQSYPEVTEQDKKIVDRYLNMLNISSFQHVTKTLDNSFILSEDKENDLIEKRRGYITFDHNIINILLKTSYGVNKGNNKIFITLDEQIESIIIKLENILGLNVLIVQREYLPGMICNGQYKKDLTNKYGYEIFVIDNNDLLDQFEIVNKINLEKEINSSYDLKQKIKQFKGGN